MFDSSWVEQNELWDYDETWSKPFLTGLRGLVY